jgi:MoaA/NifB/PqqE/SkfB family radical SAM enzyme
MILSDGTALKPSRAIFYPTLRCNLSCKMCFQRKHDRMIEELSMDEIINIFDNVDLSEILLVGGEIFVRKDIIQVLDYFNSKIENVIIQTNGTLIGEYEIDCLLKMDNLKEIWISLDGLEYTHDQIRGKDVFRKVINVIRRLKDKKKIIVNSVMMSENIDELVNLYEFLNNEGVYEITYQFQMMYSKDQHLSAKHKLKKMGIVIDMYDDCVENSVEIGRLNELESVINRLKASYKNTKISFYPKIFEENISAYLDGTIFNEHKIICKDIINSVLKVNPSGELMICEALKCSQGSLKDNRINEIWNCRNIKRLRVDLSNNNLIDLCSRCCCIDYMIN